MNRKIYNFQYYTIYGSDDSYKAILSSFNMRYGPIHSPQQQNEIDCLNQIKSFQIIFHQQNDKWNESQLNRECQSSIRQPLSQTQSYRKSRLLPLFGVRSQLKYGGAQSQIQSLTMEKVQAEQQVLHIKMVEFSTEIQKDNASYRDKLNRIKMGKSTYNFNKNQSFITSKANNFYLRKRREDNIQFQNPQIARRIINVKGYQNNSKTDLEYSRTRQIMHRLQRFPIIQRLSSFSQRKAKAKTQSIQYSPSYDGSRRFSLIQNQRQSKYHS